MCEIMMVLLLILPAEYCVCHLFEEFCLSVDLLYLSFWSSVIFSLLQGNFFASFFLGWAVTTVSGVCVYPFDTLRRRMMLTSGQPSKYRNATHCGEGWCLHLDNPQSTVMQFMRSVRLYIMKDFWHFIEESLQTSFWGWQALECLQAMISCTVLLLDMAIGLRLWALPLREWNVCILVHVLLRISSSRSIGYSKKDILGKKDYWQKL